jgi:F-type H+-transporting ATPase subunit a
MMQAPDIGGMILHHTADSHVLEFDLFLLGKFAIPLPTGWHLFGIDVSPTKHVVYMILAALLVFVSMMIAARQVDRRHREGRAPRGFGAAMEALVLFVRNDVAIANIGHAGAKFAPYILTLFFFILFMNLLGLVPWGGSATGNLSVTMALAILSFILIEVSGMRALGFKGYMGTIFYAPPGMHPIGRAIMLLIMTPVEFLGKLTKPFALMIRLFANMTAGHTLILSLGGLIFVFMNAVLVMGGVAVASTAMATAIMILEVFVAFLQAYIFAMLTSVFVGLIRHAH